MTDPVTNNYSLVEPTVGGDINLWGGVLNGGVILPIDASLGANISVPITVADVILTTSQFQNAIFVITGALTGNRNLILPLSPNSATVAVGGRFVVVNNTTGAYNLSVKTAASGSVGVVVPQGFTALLYSDGTNVGYGSNGLPGFAAAVNGNPNGQLAGTAGSVNTNASLAFDYTNSILYVCVTTGNATAAVWAQSNVVIGRGFDTAINLGLSVTHTGGNLLNVAVKTAAGADPTVTSPIIVRFQTASGANTTGAPTDVDITGALSMNTNALGATLGSSNSIPFRIWFALFNNAGTAVLAMRICSTAGTIYPIAEYGVASTTQISGSATSAGVWYTPNGTALTNCAFRVIGYSEYTSGLTTAGTYTSDPSNTVIFGPGIKLPGEVIQSIFQQYGTYGTGSNTYTPSATLPTVSTSNLVTSQAITPTSTVNLLKVRSSLQVMGGAASYLTLALMQDSGANAISAVYCGVGALLAIQQVLEYWAVANTVSATTFKLYAAPSTNNIYWNTLASAAQVFTTAVQNSFLAIDEIMG